MHVGETDVIPLWLVGIISFDCRITARLHVLKKQA